MLRTLLSRRICLLTLFAVGISLAAAAGHAQSDPSADSSSATSIPADNLVQPQQLNQMLQKPGQEKPLVLQVGSRVLYAQAHIPGSEYAGPASRPAGQELLRSRVASLPKDKLILLYCGCCPWQRCPNVGPAYQLLHGLGFTNVKVVYIASNFGDDWVAKGYPVEEGR